MVKSTVNIQDGFLFRHLKEASTLRAVLINGEKIEGRLKRFDRFVLVVESGGEEILVYKHAVASLAAVPS